MASAHSRLFAAVIVCNDTEFDQLLQLAGKRVVLSQGTYRGFYNVPSSFLAKMQFDPCALGGNIRIPEDRPVIVADLRPRNPEPPSSTQGAKGSKKPNNASNGPPESESESDDDDLPLPPTKQVRSSLPKMSKGKAPERDPEGTLKPADAEQKGEASKKSRNEACEYIRIGTQPCPKDGDGTIEREFIVVADMSKRSSKGRRKISFLVIDAWSFAGLQIGHHEGASEINLRDKSTKWEPDYHFGKLSEQHIMDKLNDIMDDKVQAVYYTGALPPQDPNDGNEDVELVRAPTAPTYAAYDARPEGLQKPKGKPTITAVVFFKNLCYERSLDLPINLQVDLEYGESYSSFLEWVLDGDHGLRAKLPNFTGGFQVEIWVLPQIEGTSEMFCWTRMKGWKAGQWLSDTVVEYYLAQLYIEVHILSNDPAAENEGDVVMPKKTGNKEGATGRDGRTKQKKRKTG